MHGIVRTIFHDGSIREATYCENKLHGLSFIWDESTFYAFQASIYDHGQFKAFIQWNADWSEK